MIPPALASFRLATTCEFMVDIEATPGTPHYYHGLPSAPRSRETLSSNPNAHVYATFRPRRVIFQSDFVLRCGRVMVTTRRLRFHPRWLFQSAPKSANDRPPSMHRGLGLKNCKSRLVQ